MRLGEILRHDDILSQEELETALSVQLKTGYKIGEILIKHQVLDSKMLDYYLGFQHKFRVDERRKFSQFRLIGDLFRRFYGVAPLLILSSILLLFFSILLSMSFPYFIKFTFDYLILTNEINPVLIVGSGVLGLMVLGQVLSYAACLNLNKANIRFANSIRNRHFKIIHHVHYSTLSQKRSGEWLNHLTTDIDNVIERWELLFLSTFKNLFAVSVSCIILYLIDASLMIFVLSLSILMIAIPGRVSNLANKYLGRRPMLITGILTNLTEMIYSFSTIKTFNAQPKVTKDFSNKFDKYYLNDFHMVRYWNVAYNLRVLIGMALICTIIFEGGKNVISGIYSTGDLMMALVIVNILNPYIDEFVQLIISVNDTKAYWQRCLTLLDINIDDHKFKNDPALAVNLDGDVCINGLSFGYAGIEVFKDLNVRFEHNKSYAIVGRSGSGKSTLLKLLLKQLTPDEGEITFNDYSLSEVSEFTVCKNISYIAQKPSVFKGTVHENIRLGGASFSSCIEDSEIHVAAKRAGIHHRIGEMPYGYSTELGDGGQQLSGGEKQRISIARALLKDPAVCLFDEPTSSLDPKNEQIIIDTISSLKGQCTILISTHNPEFLNVVDQVLVLGDNPKFISANKLSFDSLHELMKYDDIIENNAEATSI